MWSILHRRIRSTVLCSLVMSSYASTAVLPRGAFIVFEGMDRCGKSTQVQLLQQALSDRPCECIRYPNRQSNIGQLINSYLSCSSELSDQTVHLLFSANRWEADEVCHAYAMRSN